MRQIWIALLLLAFVSYVFPIDSSISNGRSKATFHIPDSRTVLADHKVLDKLFSPPDFDNEYDV